MTKSIDWYNPTNIKSYDKFSNFIIGGRGIGKTYGFKKDCISRYKKKGKQYSATFDTAFMPKAMILNDEKTEKVLNEIPSDFIKEYGTFYPNCTIKIREAPSQKGNDTGLYYTNGMSVRYDGYVKRDGYVWISWIGGSGKRRWMAGGELNSKGINSLPYGVFK